MVRNALRRVAVHCPWLLGALFAASACQDVSAAADPLWSEVTGERQSASALHRAGTRIRTIDGQPVSDKVARVRPGQHTLQIQWVPSKGLRTSDRTLRLDMKPCRRYYVHAQFASPGSTLWQAIVDKTEPVPGCTLPPGETPAPTGPATPRTGTGGRP